MGGIPRIGIFHLSINPCGGAERVAVILGKSLRELGYNVELITIERTDWKKVQLIFGVGKEAFDREIVIPPFVALPTIYSRFAYWLLRDILAVPLLRSRFDLTITTIQTYPVTFSDVLYVHIPHLFLDFIPDSRDVYHPRYSKGIWRAYSLPFRLLSTLSVRVFNCLRRKPVILTNSTYSKRIIQDHLDVNPRVVYPPVDAAKYSEIPRASIEGNVILTISRLESTKHLETVPRVASEVSGAKFVVVGGTGRTSSEYVSTILEQVRRMGLGDRVSILLNVSEAGKRELLSKSKIYLHTMRFEHFGISIVEAMAAGLVPVVHESGGQWLDILGKQQGECGYSYSDTEKAAQIIEMLLRNGELRSELSSKARQRALLFDTVLFKNLMGRIVNQLIKTKQTG